MNGRMVIHKGMLNVRRCRRRRQWLGELDRGR